MGDLHEDVLCLKQRIAELERERDEALDAVGYWKERESKANKLITVLVQSRDDLQAYKDLARELANRKGYDSLAGVFDNWEQRDLEQQIKALESVLNACCPVSGYVINDESSRNYIACEIEQLRKGANND